VKEIKLLSKSSQKWMRFELELTEKDVEEFPKGLIPGEWVIIVDGALKFKYIAYVNPHALNPYKIKLLKQMPITWIPKLSESEVGKNTLIENLDNALNKRKILNYFNDGCRLIYGMNDYLPGLIVDMYEKDILIQINTAGLDRFREEIMQFFEKEFPHKRSILFDNVEYRKNEILPSFDQTNEIKELKVLENGFQYLISGKTVQKIGYYYDHRDNRARMLEKLKSLHINKENGLDLFSYVGSWGLHLLSAGVNHVEFVDQADMDSNINNNLELNGFRGRGSFIRSDVFKFLDIKQSENKKYDVVVSDPPAFAKSEANKSSAIHGYQKLHSKALSLVSTGGVFVVASCTHYVDLMELDKTVQEAANKNNRKVQLLDLGIQGNDHIIRGLQDKGLYIKYLLYRVE
jgi:23S rRNA (cytosine1962-C5)-methyltransferase